ncbi:hypothetical protein ACFFOS_27405 [Nocardioides kongjuensis]|uniref:Putative esterase n=1 Tax=Nocardioides kongjuensis TaxID=349522 RepID=A0A852RGN8_9ACTN|nr:hypothetical protein [Nocardioides kongjuensis]NYD32721.1 putative esterase [Nocardioides kongjuensis]
MGPQRHGLIESPPRGPTPRRPARLGYRAFIPANPERLLVLVHGQRRDSARLFRAFLPSAIYTNVALMAPTFGDREFTGYQRLAGRQGQFAAHDALVAAVASLKAETSLQCSTIDLFGYSGGAQFAHRFTLVSPHLVQRAAVAASGWYTYLRAGRRWPYGLEHSSGTSTTVDPVAFLTVPILVLVGERDVRPGPAVRSNRRLDREQGIGRLERALRWVDHTESVARTLGATSNVTFDLLSCAGHSFGEAARAGLVDKVMAHFNIGNDGAFGSCREEWNR